MGWLCYGHGHCWAKSPAALEATFQPRREVFFYWPRQGRVILKDGGWSSPAVAGGARKL